MRNISDSEAISIADVIRKALVFDPKRSEARVNTDELLDSVDRFFQLLSDSGVHFVLVGGVALLQYVEGRNTEDIDLILDAASLAGLPGVKITGDEEFFARAAFGELRIDVLKTAHPLFAKVRNEMCIEKEFRTHKIPCATVEGLILLKLYALPSLYRQGNFARVGLYENDVATLLQAYRPAVEPLLAILSQHVSPSDAAEIRKIAGEIGQRISRFEQRNTSE